MRSSQRLTADGSTLAMRAISSVRRWSHKFHPRCWASCAAMAPPPQPYSRSMVTSRNMATSLYRELVYRDSAGLAFFHQEYHWDHHQDSPGEKPEIINVGQHRGLPLHCTFNHGVGLSRGECRAGSVRAHGLLGALHHRLERRVRGAEIVGQSVRVSLRAPVKHGGG